MSTTTPDFVAIKTRQQATWASGDYSRVGALIQVVSELLVDSADLRPGDEVLDVAAGSGNTSIAAARLGAQVTGIDYVPALIERARERGSAERLPIEFSVADAEDLPFASATFDAVVSVFGVMFAPDHQRAASELLRVCRPDGTIALASWTPAGFIGGLLRTVSGYVPPPAGLASPLAWGTEDHVRSLLGDEITALTARERSFTFRFSSPGAFVDFFQTYYGPTVKAFGALDPAGQTALRLDLKALARQSSRLADDGPVAIASSYLQVVATRR